ncbi:MAG: hypothetical protein TREMPRED_005887 [Tremellales sp. Tagirdzhanova-0007]|nr:MAG: hypothetical protein TREMPRED_005887 [Tremellales sp. Tagirdzhanova-0007]
MTGAIILNRPISVYTLPTELLSNLSVRTIQAQPHGASSPPDQPRANAVTSVGGINCQTCPGAAFESIEEQRAHFKSDWHRYNVKAKLIGRTVTEEELGNLVEGVSSISGSASSSSGSSNGKITRLLNKSHLDSARSVDSDEEAELANRQRRAHLRTAVIWFSPTCSVDNLGIPKDTQFGIHRALFPPYDTAADYLAGLRNLQLRDSDDGEERRIAMLMVAGGHFAGMVVGLRPRGKNDRQDVKGAGDVRVIQHKTFHRYTTRKKQGGSQALNDNAKSKAVSAGAMLRRYGEQALQEEIRALMIEWEEDIALSERVFIRASTHGKKSFWGYEGAVIQKGDDRIRVFPFPTRRPTLQELLRCWHELTRVKVSHLSQEALQTLDDAYIASIQPRKQPPKPTVALAPPSSTPLVPRLSPEEEARLDRQHRLVDMVRKGRLEALRPFWDKHQSEFDSSILGTAASSGQEEVLLWFLQEVKIDPTAPIEGRRAYDLASTRDFLTFENLPPLA